MADPKQWFRTLNTANEQVLDAVYQVIPSVEHYLGDPNIVNDYFLLSTSERRTDVAAQDVIDAGRILNELKAWLDAADGATSVTRKSRLFKLRGPSL